MDQIVIDVGQQMDGVTFQLSPQTKAMLASRFPGLMSRSSVFVADDVRHDFELAHGSLWKHVALILTGLSEEQVEDLGGVTFVNPATRQVLFASAA